MIEQLQMVIPPLPRLAPHFIRKGDELVVFLHGLWRSHGAMKPLARHLSQHQFSTLNLPYASFLESFDQITESLISELEPIVSDFQKVHFVTHSMGGIVLRHLLAAWRPETLGQIVMIAPPNRGSAIVDWASESPLTRFILGPAGSQLHPSYCQSMTPFFNDSVGVPLCIIMGNRPTIPFVQWLLNDVNDGIVTVEEGKLRWAQEFHIVNADHTFMMAHPEVKRLTLAFFCTNNQKECQNSVSYTYKGLSK